MQKITPSLIKDIIELRQRGYFDDGLAGELDVPRSVVLFVCGYFDFLR